VSDHVHLEIADYLAGRLPDDRRRRFEDHMRRCESCSAEVRWAAEFREEALRQGLRHLDPSREIEIATGHEPATDAERAHLDLCPTCRAELDWAREHAADEDEAAEEDEPPAPRSRRIPWGGFAAAAAAVLILALVWLTVPRPDRSVVDLARPEPLPVRTVRSAPEPGSFEALRLDGLDAYAAGEYAVAREALRRAVELRPEQAEVRLYLGSAALLLGEPEAAVAELDRAAGLAESPALRDEATWQAGQAALASDRPDEAARRLRSLAEGEGRRAAEARGLLETLERRR